MNSFGLRGFFLLMNPSADEVFFLLKKTLSADGWEGQNYS